MSRSPKYGDPDYHMPGKALGNPVVMSFDGFADHLYQQGLMDSIDNCRAFFGRHYDPLPPHIIYYPFERRVFGANVMPHVPEQLARIRAMGLDLIHLLHAADEYYFATYDDAVHDKLYLVKLTFG